MSSVDKNRKWRSHQVLVQRSRLVSSGAGLAARSDISLKGHTKPHTLPSTRLPRHRYVQETLAPASLPTAWLDSVNRVVFREALTGSLIPNGGSKGRGVGWGVKPPKRLYENKLCCHHRNDSCVNASSSESNCEVSLAMWEKAAITIMPGGFE